MMNGKIMLTAMTIALASAASALPKAIVLMIGTNNTGHRKTHEASPTDTALGVQSVLGRLGKLFPKGGARGWTLVIRSE